MGPVSAGVSEVVPNGRRRLPSGAELTIMRGASGLGEVVFQLKAPPGRRIPLHRPFAVAEILLLEGGASGNGAIYSAGDLLSVRDHPGIRLVSHPKLGCLCLVAAHDPFGLAVEGLAPAPAERG